MPRMVLVPPGPVRATDDEIHAPVKFLDGLKAYAQRFPGPVTLVATPTNESDATNLGGVVRRIDDLGIECVLTRDILATMRKLKPDVALVPLSVPLAPLIGAARRTVIAAEHTGASRLAMALAERPGPLVRARLEVGYRRLHRRLLRIAAAADGVQCNGIVAWDGFRRVARSAVRVYDNRIRHAWVGEARRIHRPWSGQALRLGFSGRLLPIKGPEYAVQLVSGLVAAGLPASLNIFGDGPLVEGLRHQAGPEVTFRGVLDFETEWCAAVASEIDVMVLPHVQSDPSGSYLESAGMGVPVLGFDNAALRALVVEGGLGWVVPMRDADALFGKAEQLLAHPDEVERASMAAFDFMDEHCFERDFDLRVDHLLEVLR